MQNEVGRLETCDMKRLRFLVVGGHVRDCIRKSGASMLQTFQEFPFLTLFKSTCDKRPHKFGVRDIAANA